MLLQTQAIFLDAYRQLNDRRLFWFALIITGAIVLAFALVGINDKGLTVAGYVIGPWFTTAMVPADAFYKFIFVQLGVNFWLTWAAAILALISTAGIIPEFITQSSIEVQLSKPISRARLFLTKYAAGLLFAALQVLVFSGASFLVIGLRGGAWEPKVFLAVPLVILFFSYLYCVCALLGVLTRSTIAALLGTGLFWFVLFAVNTTESVYLAVKVETEQRLVGIDARIAEAERAARATPGDESEKPKGVVGALAESVRGGSSAESIERWRHRRDELAKDLKRYQYGHSIAFGVKTALPKTSETMGLLEREMISLSEFSRMMNRSTEGREVTRPRDPDDPDARVNDRRAQQEIQRIVRERSPWWIIGTSLLFEVFVLLIATRVFVRRDY